MYPYIAFAIVLTILSTTALATDPIGRLDSGALRLLTSDRQQVRVGFNPQEFVRIWGVESRQTLSDPVFGGNTRTVSRVFSKSVDLELVRQFAGSNQLISLSEATTPVGASTKIPFDSSEGVSAWMVSQGKTVTYRIAASIDALIVGYLYTGTLLGGGGIALFNAVVSSILYDTHEILWNNFGPAPQVDPTRIALVKTVSYRMVSIANVLATGLFFTGNLWLSGGLALGNAVIDSTIYFFHELAWNYWGPPIRVEFVRGNFD